MLQETLRLYPSVPVLFRTPLKDDEVAGERVGPGDFVVVSPWCVHRHRRLWEDPHAFDPVRFEGRPTAYLQGGAFLPFSTGPRVCIGATFAMAEASLLLARLIETFEFRMDDPRPVMPVGRISIVPGHRPPFRLEPLGRRLRAAA